MIPQDAHLHVEFCIQGSGHHGKMQAWEGERVENKCYADVILYQHGRCQFTLVAIIFYYFIIWYSEDLGVFFFIVFDDDEVEIQHK